MIRSRNASRILTSICAVLSVLSAVAIGAWKAPMFTNATGRPAANPIDRDLADIKAGDTLTALLSYNSTGYFIYDGSPMGFDYELLRQFAADNHLHLRTVVVRDMDSVYSMLNNGRGDIAAARLVPTDENSNQATFTRPLYSTRPVLVQRDGPAVRSAGDRASAASDPNPSAIDANATIVPAISAVYPVSAGPERPEPSVAVPMIHSSWQLHDQHVVLPRPSPYYDRMVQLSDEIQGDIEIEQPSDERSAESILRGVSSGKFDLSVVPENLARLSEHVFPNITVATTLGQRNSVAWAVRSNAPKLQKALDAWIADKQQHTDLFTTLYAKYFEDGDGYRTRQESKYLTGETGLLSRYDSLFRQYADGLGWDWRLLAAQSFQESRFNPTAESFAGAMGLLQLMPGTATDMHVSDPYDPVDNVRGAVRFLEYLDDFWKDRIPDPAVRQKFVLASYNAGPGHVVDAQRLAVEHGGDEQNWPDVAKWLQKLSDQTVYSDPVVRHGYCRGTEPVTYVSRIFDRYDHYRQFTTVG